MVEIARGAGPGRAAGETADPASDGAPPRLVPDAYRAVMRTWPTGVTVVATSVDGALEGCTVSAFTSVSATPPSILVCLDVRSRTHAAVLASKRFSVNVLAVDQADLAVRFSRPGVPGRFDGVSYGLELGVPVLEGVASYLVCEVGDAVAAGDHTIFVGHPIGGRPEREEAAPLLYLDRMWRAVALPPLT